MSVLALVTHGAGDTHFALAIPRTVTEDANCSTWTAVTWQAETNSVIQVKALFAGVTVKTLITHMTIALPCGLVAALYIQTSNLRTVTHILWGRRSRGFGDRCGGRDSAAVSATVRGLGSRGPGSAGSLSGGDYRGGRRLASCARKSGGRGSGGQWFGGGSVSVLRRGGGRQVHNLEEGGSGLCAGAERDGLRGAG